MNIPVCTCESSRPTWASGPTPTRTSPSPGTSTFSGRFPILAGETNLHPCPPIFSVRAAEPISPPSPRPSHTNQLFCLAGATLMARPGLRRNLRRDWRYIRQPTSPPSHQRPRLPTAHPQPRHQLHPRSNHPIHPHQPPPPGHHHSFPPPQPLPQPLPRPRGRNHC